MPGAKVSMVEKKRQQTVGTDLNISLKKCVLLFLALFCIFQELPAAERQAALFIHHESLFWNRFVSYTVAAAKDLGLELKVYNAEDSRAKMLEQVGAACRDGVDAVIFFNYEGIGESILQIAESFSTPAFLVNTALDDPLLIPRNQYTHWIGSLTPDDGDAGVLLIQRLLDTAREKGISHFNLLAFTGRAHSRAHQLRYQGLQQFIKSREDISLIAAYPVSTSEKDAIRLFKDAIRRHPEINIVWSISDHLALLATEEAEKLGVRKDLVFGGVDWNPAALASVGKGGVDIDIGGHVFDGALATVLVYDYLNGHDFASESLNFDSSMVAIDAGNSGRFQSLLARPDEIDYRSLSKVYNTELLQYDFNLNAIARRVEQILMIKLTQEEKTWLAEHPVIRIGVMDSWPPFNFVDKNGNPQGIGADYIMSLNKRLNGVLEIVPGPWEQIYDDVANRRLDA